MSEFKEILNKILSSVGIDKPDGRPLYEYKISTIIFKDLKSNLSLNWNTSEECFACFILYSIEFIRSEFEEGHLNWRHFFESIGQNRDNLPEYRAAITKKAFKYWKRDLYIGNNATEYLESLRFESGLPNYCLKDGGYISELITYSFQYIESYRITEENLLEIIANSSQKNRLPNVLQQPTFYQLVVKFSVALLELKLKYSLGNVSNPLEVLNEQEKYWRKGFPVKIDKEGLAREFIDRLLIDISKTVKLERPVAEVIYHLKLINGCYKIETLLNIPTGYYSYDALTIKEKDFQKLPTFFNINVEYGFKTKTISSVTKTNSNKVSCRHLENKILPDGIYKDDWSISFSAPDNSVDIKYEMSNRFQLPKGVPLIFTKKDEQWIYKGQGSIRVCDNEALILVPKREIPFMSSMRKTGEVVNEFDIYHIKENFKLIDEQNDLEYHIRLAQNTEEVYGFEFLQNNTVPNKGFDFLDSNSNVFIGVPKIYKFNHQTGIKQRFKGTIQYKSAITNKWEDVEKINEYGLLQIRCLNDANEVVALKRIGILPKDFYVTINQQPAQIILNNARQLTVLVERNTNEIKQNINENNIVITFDSAFNFTSDHIKLRINNLAIELPNPIFNEVFVDKDKFIVNRIDLDINNLFGYRILLNNLTNTEKSKTITFCLNDEFAQDHKPLTISKKIRIESNKSIEIPLYKYKTDFEKLLAFTQSVGAFIKVSTERPHHYIEIKQHTIELDYSDGLLLRSENMNPSQIALSAFRLDKEFKKESIVNISFDHVQNGWSLTDNLKEEGLWFVFSNKDSANIVRPKPYRIGERNEVVTEAFSVEYVHQTCGMNYLDRKSVLTQLFDDISLDFENPNWKELNELYVQTKHLPLNALDVWKGLVASEKGLVSYLFNLSDFDLIKRLGDEFCINWHLIPIKTWLEIFENFKLYLENSSFKSHAQVLLEGIEVEGERDGGKFSDIAKKLGLISLVEIIKHNYYENKLDDYPISYLVSLSLNGESGAIGLRGRYSGGVQWHDYASEYIINRFSKLPVELKSFVPEGILSFQKPVIYLPFIFAYHSVIGNFITGIDNQTRLGLKLNSEFDKEYFDTTYSYIQAFCYKKYYKSTSNG